MATLSDSEWALFETWLTSTIKDRTDADPEVVAEYIVALLKSHQDLDEAYARCLDDIPEFFAEGVDAQGVLRGIFRGLKEKVFLPEWRQRNRPSQLQDGSGFGHEGMVQGSQAGQGQGREMPGPQSWTNGGFNPGAAPFTPGGIQYGRGGRIIQVSRKRGRQDDADDMASGMGGGERPIKQLKRGKGRKGRASQRSDVMNGRADAMPGLVPTYGGIQAPGQVPQYSLEDMQNLLNSLAAMSAAMGMPLPPNFPGANAIGMPSMDTRRPCFTFQKTGSCPRGDACPYKHVFGLDTVHQSNGTQPRNGKQRQRGHAEFSSNHPPPDDTATAIVVEHIPKEQRSEEAVREFYAQFGDITGIEMKDDRALAIVHFSDHESARKAWQSPKVVFDNRFVRVYWHRPELVAGFGDETANGQLHREAETFDAEEFARIAEERQKEHVEKQRKREELEAQRTEIASKLKTFVDAKRELIDKLAAQDPHGVAEEKEGTGEPLTWEEKKNTEALRERLAALEAQAESLGLKGEEEDDFTRGFSTFFRGRGHRGIRGRGFGSRARGYGGQRGAYHGSSQGGVMRLDNRPKSIVVSLSKDDEGKEWTAEHDEALRSFLVAGDDFDGLATHPDRRDSQIVTFKERYMAEMFAAAAHSIPGIGPVWLAWAPRELTGVTASMPADAIRSKIMREEALENGEDEDPNQQLLQEHAMAEEEEDFDIA